MPCVTKVVASEMPGADVENRQRDRASMNSFLEAMGHCTALCSGHLFPV